MGWGKIIKTFREMWRILPLAGALALFCTAWWFADRTVHPKPEGPNQHAQKEAAPKKDGEEYWKALWKRTTDDPIALYTATLTIFTALLATVSAIQFRYVIRADRTAAIAANAAAESADILRQAEQAVIHVVYHEDTVFEFIRSRLTHFVDDNNAIPGDIFQIWPTLRYSLKNYGQTMGVIRDMRHGMYYGNALPKEPTYQTVMNVLKERALEVGGCTQELECRSQGRYVTRDARGLGRANPSAFWFFGRVDYSDRFGKTQVHRFLFRYDDKRRRLIYAEHPGYSEDT